MDHYRFGDQSRFQCDFGHVMTGAPRFQSSFLFGCEDEAFRLTGQSSKKNNYVTCMEDGTWDFGTLRCEGPVCEDPGRPADGEQISDSYE